MSKPHGKRRNDEHAKPASVTLGKWRNHYTWASVRGQKALKIASLLSKAAAFARKGKPMQMLGALAQLPEGLRTEAAAMTPDQLTAKARQMAQNAL